MGAVALPCSTQLRRADLEHRVAAANPKLCVGEDELLAELPDGVPAMTLAEVADVLDEDRPQETPASIEPMDPEDPALIVFTSGTTGEPRGVVHAYRYLFGQQAQAEHWFGSRKGELAWCTTATGWSKSARNVFLAPWLTGAAAVIHDGRFDPAERLDFAEALGSTSSARRRPSTGCSPSAPPCAPSPPCGGWSPPASRSTPRRSPPSARRPDSSRPTATARPRPATSAATSPASRCGSGSMGKPLPGIEIRIAAPGSEAEEAATDLGELQLRAASSPTFFSRYLDGERFEGEWWRTGDLVREDEDGYLFFEGRDDDIILSAGYRIGPFEVESALQSHPAVAEAAAVAAPDPERGSVVRAVVVPREREPSEELARELQEHCKRETAPYKFPRIVEFVAELPKTSSGKIKRAQLRG